jgi:hypothetical protein
MEKTVRETEKLINFLNDGLMGKPHKMEDIYTTSPVTYIYYQSQLNEIEKLLYGQTDKYEFAPNKEKALEMFDMVIPDTAMVIREFKQYSGTLNPKVLIAKLHNGIRKAGNRIRYNEKVTGLKRKNGIYSIEITNTTSGENKTLLSKKVVAAAGPYNGPLVLDIAPYFSKLITPKRLFLAFLKINRSKYESLMSEQKKKLQEFYPVANLNSEIFYSMIEKYDEDGIPLLKVGGHFLRTDIDDLDASMGKGINFKGITPKRLFLAFLKINRSKYESLMSEQKKKLQEFYPVANLNSEIFYSMIEKYDEDGIPLLKVGGHFLRTDIDDLDAVWAKELTSKEIQWSKENTAAYFALLNLPIGITDLEFSSGYSCVYSLTTSEVPYVTNVIKNDSEVESNFVLVGGMSGIGAKGSLAYGLIAADVLLNKDENSGIYLKTKTALGSERLMKDLQDSNE